MTVRIRVSVSDPLLHPGTSGERPLDLPAGATVGMLLDALGFREEEQDRLGAIVNGNSTSFASILSEGDRVRVLRLFGGG